MSVDSRLIPSEAAETLLAKNLVAARLARGWTQEALSAASRISRATIASLEGGTADPRLSTLAAIAKALGVWPSLLIVGPPEAAALARRNDRPPAPAPAITESDRRRLSALLSSGMLRDRADAARMLAELASALPGASPTDAVISALIGTHLPDPATAIGLALIDRPPQSNELGRAT